jgi:3-dehydroquinate synthetase
METVLVGAPGCGARVVGRVLAERSGARFIDLTGEPGARADTIAGLLVEGPPDAGPPLRRVIAADRIVADPAVRARLYRGRHVLWLDVPLEQLVERVRASRHEDVKISGDVRAVLARLLAADEPFYSAGTRIDASGSIDATIGRLMPSLAEPIAGGTLVLRAELHGGLIELGEGILARSLVHVMRRDEVQRCVILTTAQGRDRAEQTAASVTETANVVVDIEELPDGEQAKRLDEQDRLFKRLATRQLERADPLLALGDDTLLEAATFAAAVWLRGVPLITAPVTTLGLIDTAIGGKGGIDLPGVGRNLLGAIHQPVAAILDVALVGDESAADRRAALSEAVKYGLIGDPRVLALLEAGVRAGSDRVWPTGWELLELVERCAVAKRRLVIADERDTTDVRAALNLGHTLSHALETATAYRLRHGDAVAYGLRAAIDIGTIIGVTPAPISTRALRLLDRLSLGVDPLQVRVDDVLTYIEADKKRRGGRLRWVLVGEHGIVIRDDVPADVARAAVGRALGHAG